MLVDGAGGKHAAVNFSAPKTDRFIQRPTLAQCCANAAVSGLDHGVQVNRGGNFMNFSEPCGKRVLLTFRWGYIRSFAARFFTSREVTSQLTGPQTESMWLLPN